MDGAEIGGLLGAGLLQVQDSVDLQEPSELEDGEGTRIDLELDMGITGLNELCLTCVMIPCVCILTEFTRRLNDLTSLTVGGEVHHEARKEELEAGGGREEDDEAQAEPSLKPSKEDRNKGQVNLNLVSEEQTLPRKLEKKEEDEEVPKEVIEEDKKEVPKAEDEVSLTGRLKRGPEVRRKEPRTFLQTSKPR